MQPPIKRWSFSALKQYEACPFRVYLQRVEKAELPPAEPDSPLERGTKIHLEAEEFVRGTGPMTKHLDKFRDEFERLQEQFTNGQVMLEEEWGFTREWESVAWGNDNCWALIKCDAVIKEDDGSITVIDYKTGKKWGKEVPHQQQLQLYALATFLKFADVPVVKAEIWYLDEGKKTQRIYPREFVIEIIDRWVARGETLTNALTFPPKPNRLNCKWCDFGTFKGTGACAYAINAE